MHACRKDTDDGMPNVYIPSLKIVLDESEKVVQIEIKWYLYSSLTAQYDEITDLSILKDIVEMVQIVLNDSGRSYEEIINFSNTTTTTIIPDNSWYFLGSDNTNTTDYVINTRSFGYRVFGASFSFDLRQ